MRILAVGWRHVGSLWVRVLLVLFSVCFPAAGDELEYSGIDRATVRVFALKGVGVERQEIDGRQIPLAVPDAGHGSGVLVDGKGLVLTAKHVAEGASMLAVQLPNVQHAVAARIVHVDPEVDVAWLAIDGTQPNFVTLPAEPEKMSVRSVVFAVGYPLDAARADPQSQRGVISGKLPDGSLQLAISLNPGNSGGPVISEDETLVGIAVARADPRQGAQGIGVAVPMSQILRSYQRAVEEETLGRARSALAAHAAGDRVRAEALSSLMTSQGMADALRLRDQPEAEEGKRFWEKLKRAIAAVGKESPELYLLAASRHFNNAVWRKRAGTGAWASAMRTARRLVDQAVGYDAELAKNEFVKLVRGVSRNAGGASSSRASSDPSPHDYTDDLGEGESLEMSPDLEILDELPAFGAGPRFSMGINPLLVGGGLSGWLYLGELLNVNFDYRYTLLVGGVDVVGGHYGALLGGFVVSSWRGKTTTKLVLDVEHHFNVTEITYTTKTLPTYSAFILEGGAIVSPLQYHYCDEVCQEETIDWPIYMSHITTLAAGIRYRYFYHAGGRALARNARQVLDLSAHLLAFDFAAPDASAHNPLDDRPLSPSPVGFQVAFSGVITPWSSMLGDLAVGLVPATGKAYVSLGITHYFY